MSAPSMRVDLVSDDTGSRMVVTLGTLTFDLLPMEARGIAEALSSSAAMVEALEATRLALNDVVFDGMSRADGLKFAEAFGKRIGEIGMGPRGAMR